VQHPYQQKKKSLRPKWHEGAGEAEPGGKVKKDKNISVKTIKEEKRETRRKKNNPRRAWEQKIKVVGNKRTQTIAGALATNQRNQRGTWLDKKGQ